MFIAVICLLVTLLGLVPLARYAIAQLQFTESLAWGPLAGIVFALLAAVGTGALWLGWRRGKGEEQPGEAGAKS